MQQADSNIDQTLLTITYLDSVTATRLSEQKTGWGPLCLLLKKPNEYARKEEMPLLKLASFRSSTLTDSLKAQGFKSPRCNPNLDQIYGVEGDYDAEMISVDEAAKRLEAAGLEAFIYTSPSHTKDAPRWRVLAPLSAAWNPGNRNDHLALLNGALGGILTGESFTLSQAYYYGRVKGVVYETARIHGRYIDDPINGLIIKPIGKPSAERKKRTAGISPQEPLDLSLMASEMELTRLRDALAEIPSDDRRMWIRVGLALRPYGDDGKKLWMEWSRKSAKWQPGDDERWATFHTTDITPASVYFIANEYKRAQTDEKAKSENKELTPYLYSPKGKIIRGLRNAVAWVERQPAAEQLRYNEFTDRVQYGAAAITDAHYSLLQIAIEGDTGIYWGRNLIAEAVNYIASRQPTHPVREWLNGLKWDGTPRVDQLFTAYYGMESSDYLIDCARVWLLGAVGRIMDPGSKLDQSILLIGDQGIGKSWGTAILFHPWSKDDLGADLHDKDASLGLRGYWAIELSELWRLQRTSPETLKGWLTRCVDSYRPPYGVNEVERPRQCIIVGTSNRADVIMDTANRRLLPIHLGSRNVALDKLRVDRDQIMAETVKRYQDRQRAPYVADAEELETVLQTDLWEEMIMIWLKGKKPKKITMVDVMLEAIGKPASKVNPYDSSRVATVLRKLGWEQKRTNSERWWEPRNAR